MNLNLKFLFGFGKKNYSTNTAKSKKNDLPPIEKMILIVDDSRTSVAVLQKTLSSAGYKVISASNGEEGVQMAKRTNPDLILMDIIMPGLNGFQATRLLRKDAMTHHIPIIIISGNEQATEKYWGLRVGANGFLAKPINNEDLFQELNKHLLHAQAV